MSQCLSSQYSLTLITYALPRTASLPSSSYRLYRLPAWEIIPNYPLPQLWSPRFWRLLAAALHPRPQLIVSHTRFFTTTLIAALLSRYYHLPWVHIEHGSSFVYLSSKLTTFIAKQYDLLLGKKIFRTSSQNIAVSHSVQKFIARFDQRPTPVIHRGLNTAAIDRLPPANLEAYRSKIILITACRLYRWKGLDNAIAAVRQLPPSLQQRLVYLIIGSGTDDTYLRTLARPPVYLLGKLEHAEVISYLKTAAIYLHPSRPGGGLATSLLEAMYCRCAVIATPHEGARDVIVHEKTGLLLPDSQPALLAAAITRLLADAALRTRLAQEAHITAQSLCSWPRAAAQYQKIFDRLLTNTPG